MANFYFGRFWNQFGYHGSSSNLEELFKKENLTLDDILDEENILQEVKGAGQTKFSNYVTQNPEYLKGMLDYIINEPAEDEENKRQFKFPFYCSEIFANQISGISNFLLNEEQPQEEENEQGSNFSSQGGQVTTQVTDTINFDTNDQDNDEEQDDQGYQKKKLKVQNDDDDEEDKDDKNQDNQNNEEQPEVEEKKDEDKQEPSSDTKDDDEEEEQPIRTREKSGQEQFQDQDEEGEDKQNQEESEEQENIDHQKKKSEELEENHENFEDDDSEDDDSKDDPVEEKKLKNSNDEDEQNIQNNEESSPKEKKKKVMYTGKQLLTHLFSFVAQDSKLNQTSCGYFYKTIQMLISKEGNLFGFLQTQRDILENFIKHVENKAIAEIIIKIITIEGTDNKDDYFKDERIFMIDVLMRKFEKKECILEELENIANIFSEIINQSINQTSMKIFDVLVEEIYKEQNLEMLFNCIQNKTENNQYQATYATQILNSLILFFIDRNTSYRKDTSMDDDMVCTEKDENFPIETFISKIPSCIKALEIENTLSGNFQTQFGTTITPFGVGRTKLIELIFNLQKSKSQGVYDKMIESNYFTLLFDLFTKYEFNNILHNLIEKIIINVLESDSEEMKKHLFDDAKILQFVISSSKTPNIQPGNQRKATKRGYYGYIIRISNFLVKQKLSNEWIANKLNECEEWNQYDQGTLAEVTQLYTKQLGIHEESDVGSSTDMDQQDNTNEQLRESYGYEFQAQQEEEVVSEEYNTEQFWKPKPTISVDDILENDFI